MRYQWYIIDLDSGSVQGSNDIEEFDDLLDDDQYVILTGQHGQYFNGSRDIIDVEAFEPDDEEEEEEEEEDDEEEEDGEEDGEEDAEHAESDAKSALDLDAESQPDGDEDEEEDDSDTFD